MGVPVKRTSRPTRRVLLLTIAATCFTTASFTAVPAASVALAGAAQAKAAPPAAAAPIREDEFTYICDRTSTTTRGEGTGTENCFASPGAPTTGPIAGTFLIESRIDSDPELECEEDSEGRAPAGTAQVPGRVVGYFCTTDA